MLKYLNAQWRPQTHIHRPLLKTMSTLSNKTKDTQLTGVSRFSVLSLETKLSSSWRNLNNDSNWVQQVCNRNKTRNSNISCQIVKDQMIWDAIHIHLIAFYSMSMSTIVFPNHFLAFSKGKTSETKLILDWDTPESFNGWRKGVPPYLKDLLVQDTRSEDHDAFGVDDGVRASG